MNAAYPLALQALSEAGLDLTDGSLSVVALDNTYTYASTDQWRTSIAGSELGSEQVAPGVTNTGGLIEHTTVTFNDIPGAETIVALAYFMDTGVAGTSALVCFVDTLHSGSAISFPTDGSNVTWEMPDGVIQL